MARDAEKAQSTLNRLLQAKQGACYSHACLIPYRNVPYVPCVHGLAAGFEIITARLYITLIIFE